MKKDDVLEVLATDTASYQDFQAFTRQSLHQLVLAEERKTAAGDIEYCYQIRKGC